MVKASRLRQRHLTSVSATTLAWLGFGFGFGFGFGCHDARHPRLGRDERTFAEVLARTHPVLDDHLIRVGVRVGRAARVRVRRAARVRRSGRTGGPPRPRRPS
eukprot:scaffold101643_cov28-Phaeocystis_antarctica.AAC.1